MIKIKSLFAPGGIVGPHMSQRRWDEEFSAKKWDYLSRDNQKEHYYIVSDLYRKHCSGSILDIGCGVGLQYQCLADAARPGNVLFTGIDISQVAITEAKTRYPGVDFRVLNYETELMAEKYGTIIFNETLYYFNHAGKTLQKCMDNNLKPGGRIIISMCVHERHELIWQYIDKRYHVLDTSSCSNDEGISWTVKVIEQ